MKTPYGKLFHPLARIDTKPLFYHCVKRVQVRSFLVRIFLYSDWIQENTDQKKLRIWTLFTQCMCILFYPTPVPKNFANFWGNYLCKKVNNKQISLLTLYGFHTLLWCFNCRFWTSKCRLGYLKKEVCRVVLIIYTRAFWMGIYQSTSGWRVLLNDN